MDITVKVLIFSKLTHRFGQQLHSSVRRFENGRGKEQTFYIVSFIKINNKFADFVGGDFCARHVCAVSVRAVFAIIYTFVAHKNFQQGNTSAVRSKRMADTAGIGVAYAAFRIFPARSRRGAGNVVFCA